MKKIKYYLLITVLLFTVYRINGQQPFIYNDKGEKINLTLREDLVLVKFIDTISIDDRLSVFQKLNIQGGLFIENKSKSLPIVFKLFDLTKNKESLMSLSKCNEVEYFNSVFQSHDGITGIVKSNIYKT